MTTKIDPIDPASMHDVVKNTHGDLVARMHQVVELFMRGNFDLAGYFNRQRRLQAFVDLLSRHPELQTTYSERALINACATCELIEPPISLVGGHEIAFDLAEFERVAARAEL